MAGLLASVLLAAAAAAQGPGGDQGFEVVDMHLHAYPADAAGPPPVHVCAPYERMPERDPRDGPDAYDAKTFRARPACRTVVASEPTDDALRVASLAMLRRYRAVAVTSGPAAMVARWRDAEPARIIPGIEFGVDRPPSVASLRDLHRRGLLKVIGEVGAQYDGARPDDPRLEPYWALAEELDVPVGIHMGPGPPGATWLGSPAYRAALSDPLLLEPVLVRHPRLRVYVMHAGWPMADRMIALMYAHPHVYVDTAVIDWSQPRAEFHAYLKRLVDAGYGKRILFGSDQMVWPGTYPAAIASIRDAPFLSAGQKRDILRDNAVRFLRLDAPSPTSARSRPATPPAAGAPR